MAQMSITAKIQVVASDEDKALLDETMSVYREACNYVSDYVFRTHDLKQFSLNKALYPTLRAEFGLKSQMTQYSRRSLPDIRPSLRIRKSGSNRLSRNLSMTSSGTETTL